VTAYTLIGGIEAVIWTDVLQVVVLLGGALVALVMVCLRADGGIAEVVASADELGKLRLVDTDWSWTGPALNVILLGAVFNNLVPYTSDQSVVQRYLTTADEARSARAVWAGALLSFPASVLFFAVGGPPFPGPAQTLLVSGVLGVSYVLLTGVGASLGYGGSVPPPVGGWGPTAVVAGIAGWLALRLWRRL